MDNKQKFIDRFWEGKTTEEEEKIIKKWLKEEDNFGNENPMLFAYFEGHETNEEMDEELLHSILTKPLEAQIKKKKKKEFNLWIAASIFMILSILGVQNYYEKQERKEALMAFETVKTELMRASINLNRYKPAVKQINQVRAKNHQALNQ
ncbi:MAG: hypothetical protein N4A45_02405 [Flavobacteriales bacterium]|jgi:hypothetical protein|nr:hypothetical protein [Flavobacteriales bacterium]